MSKEYDIIIVGGGTAGLSCAYWLVRDHNLKVAVLEKSKVKNQTHQSPEISENSLGHYFHIFRKHGQKKISELWENVQDNLALINEELSLIPNTGFSIYKNGTITVTDELPESYEDFIEVLKDENFPLEECSNGPWSKSYKLCHEATYNRLDFLDKVSKKIDGKIDYIESETCLNMYKKEGGIELKTDKDIYKTKKVILANSSTLTRLLPELSSSIRKYTYKTMYYELDCKGLDIAEYSILQEGIDIKKYKKGVLVTVKVDSTKNDHDIKMYIDSKFEKLFGKVKRLKEKEFHVGFTVDFLPISGQSSTHSNVFYIGGFSGQSRGLAFKMAQELVRDLLLA